MLESTGELVRSEESFYQPAQAPVRQHVLFSSTLTNHCYALPALNTMDQL